MQAPRVSSAGPRSSCSSSSRSPRWRSESSGSPTAPRPRFSARSSPGTRSSCAGRWSARQPCGCSTTHSSISRCCSSRWPSTRSSDGRAPQRARASDHLRRPCGDGTPTRTEEHGVGLGVARAVPRALRRHGARRARVPLARLTAIDGIWITELSPDTGRKLAVKDLFDTAGIRTTYGSAVFSDHVPTASAEAVRRLEAAGWANAGKANLHEFAYGVTSQNLHYGVVPNPAFPDRTAGGSSGGSAAALALGAVEGALGSDTGGSIRIPAACCAVVGFKPTFGLVPIEGVFPLAPSFDHAGPMAHSVGGVIELMRGLVP